MVDEGVAGQTVEVDVADLAGLADLEVVGSLRQQQDAVLSVVETRQPPLHLRSRRVLADVLRLNHSGVTDALTFSKKDLSLTYSK